MRKPPTVPKAIKVGNRYAYQCIRCDHSWMSDESEGYYLRCPKCKNYYWWMPKGTMPTGRPAKTEK